MYTRDKVYNKKVNKNILKGIVRNYHNSKSHEGHLPLLKKVATKGFERAMVS